MKIAIIDNESRYIHELVWFLENKKQNEVNVFRFNNFDPGVLSGYDLIVLSGGYKEPVSLNPKRYQAEIELVRNTDKPVLGICMGMEIIVYAFGGELERMHNKESKELELKWLEESPVSNSFSHIKVPEHHRWRIKSLGSELSELAESKDGIEAVNHKTKPIYGFQFHPELSESVDPKILEYIK